MRHPVLALALSLALPGGAALAEGFSIHDFGVVASRADCMSKAQKVLNAYLGAYGGYEEVTVTDWVTYGWDLLPGDQDVAIMCPVLPDGSFYSFMVVYGETDLDTERNQTADRLAAFWNN